MHEVYAAPSQKSFWCICNASFTDFTQVAEHVIKNQYKVKDDNSNIVLGSPKDSYEYPRVVQKARPRRNGPRKNNFLSRDNGRRP